MENPKKRDSQFNIRVDKELLDQARQKADKGYGGLAAVIRAMLRAFVAGHEQPYDERDLTKERIAAPKAPDANKGGRPPKRKKKK